MKVCSGKSVYTACEKTVETGKKIMSAFQSGRQITELPRFSSPEMAMARAQNKITFSQMKAAKTFKFPKAEAADLKRLTDSSIEASYSRVTWTNPKDGKIYHILREAEVENGNIAVRILNEDGSFLKNAEITPKKIIVVDDFTVNQASIYGIPHGELVTTYLRRNNPFAQVEKVDVGFVYPTDSKFTEAFEQILQRIKNGEKIDYITCSKGAMCNSTIPMRGIDPRLNVMTDIADSGTRVLFAAGNSFEHSKETVNQVLLLVDKVEGVGSLSPNTLKLSDFSASRNSFFTQHYEVGEHHIRPTEFGANITGIPGTDLVITNPQYRQEVEHNFLIGKSIERVNNLLKKINTEIDDVLGKKMGCFRGGRPDFESMRKLDARLEVLKQRKNKLFRLRNSAVADNGKFEAQQKFIGTSFSTPIRTAKLALTDSLAKVFE